MTTTNDHAWHWRPCPRCGADLIEGDDESWPTPARMLVGAVLLNTERLSDAMDLRPSDLGDEHLADVWRVVTSLALSQQLHDFGAVVTQLERTTGRASRPPQGWACFVLDVMAECPQVTHAACYAAQVREGSDGDG